METVSMVAPTQNCDIPPNATLRCRTMRAGIVAVVCLVRYCQNIKEINRTEKTTSTAMIFGEAQESSSEPHSSAKRRQVMEGRNNAVPKGSKCLIVSLQFASFGFCSSSLRKKPTTNIVMPPKGRLM